MQISTNEFLLGSLGDLLAQQSNVNQLNQQIATGQTLLDASSNPVGAGEAIGLASADQSPDLRCRQRPGCDRRRLQNGLSVLQQVSTVIDQLRQTAQQGANAGNSAAPSDALAITAQSGLQQLLQLANSQDANGRYIFAGSKSNTAPFQTLPNGQVTFTGDAGTNILEVAPSLSGADVDFRPEYICKYPGGREWRLGVGCSDQQRNSLRRAARRYRCQPADPGTPWPVRNIEIAFSAACRWYPRLYGDQRPRRPGRRELFGNQQHGGLGQLHTRCRSAVRRLGYQHQRDTSGRRPVLSSSPQVHRAFSKPFKIWFPRSDPAHRIPSKSRMRSPISTARKPTFCRPKQGSDRAFPRSRACRPRLTYPEHKRPGATGEPAICQSFAGSGEL